MRLWSSFTIEDWKIIKSTLTVEIPEIAARAYDGTATTVTATLKNGETVLDEEVIEDNDITVTYEFEKRVVGEGNVESWEKVTEAKAAGNYRVTATATGDNFTADPAMKEFTINKATATVTLKAEDLIKPAGYTDGTVGVTISGIVESDKITLPEVIDIGTGVENGTAITADTQAIKDIETLLGDNYELVIEGNPTLTIRAAKLVSVTAKTSYIKTSGGDEFVSPVFDAIDENGNKFSGEIAIVKGPEEINVAKTYKLTVSDASTLEVISDDIKVTWEVKETGVATVKARTADLGGQIKLNVYMTLPDSITDPENEGYVVFTKNGEETKLAVSELTYRTVGEEKQYKIAVPYRAIEMHDDVNIKVYNKDDVLIPLTDSNNANYDDGYTMSLSDYLDLAISKSTNPKMVALAKATRDYGIAAQKYFQSGDYTNLNFSEEFNQLSKEELQNALSEYAMTESGSLPEGIAKVAMTLECRDVTTFRLKVQFNSGYDASKFTFKIDGKTVKLNDNAFVVREIGSLDLNKSHVFTISDGTTTYSTTRSALSWAYAASKATTQKNVDLARALYLFNAKATDYIS